MKQVEVLRELKAMGTAQNRKVYARHGVTGDIYGVSYANLGKLKRQIRRDHALAEELWATGNHDARVLATMIADPAQMTARKLDTWARDLDNYVLTDAFSGLAGEAPAARGRMEAWTAARDEWKGAAGWNVLCRLVMAEVVDDDELTGYLEVIERGIHDAPNRVRYAMNNALIAIGMRPKLYDRAIAAARRIGRVEVDHGQTGCRTPDAAAYIVKAVEHRMKTKNA